MTWLKIGLYLQNHVISVQVTNGTLQILWSPLLFMNSEILWWIQFSHQHSGLHVCHITVRSYFDSFKQRNFSLAFWVGNHFLTLEQEPSLFFCVRTPFQGSAGGDWGREFPRPFRQELYQGVIKEDSFLAPLRSYLFQFSNHLSNSHSIGYSPSSFPADIMLHYNGINAVQYLQK